MTSESQLVVEIWDLVRDTLPVPRRLETAIQMLRAFEEFGFEPEAMADLADEDVYLARAYEDLYDEYPKEHDEEEEE